MVYTLVARLHASSEENAKKVQAKLVEAAGVYRKDKGTLGWYVMQDAKDPLKFTIVERYVKPEDLQTHLNNPYWPTFDPYVKPLLKEDIDLTFHHEMDVAVPNQDSVNFKGL
ncbi:hypothetical protein BZG36_00529 [Bifiguratus adelaidae]|uniref:ABM domain-containing protein n=1 Tax=Bifiguratus adelaidae TaxID=1938954 RepID=A0A261Y7W0_9FUNG|nr:hypothetical protein BZG36_00529 [Bifiguratus adelaidae]